MLWFGDKILTRFSKLQLESKNGIRQHTCSVCGVPKWLSPGIGRLYCIQIPTKSICSLGIDCHAPASLLALNGLKVPFGQKSLAEDN